MTLDLNPTTPRPENETKPLVDRRTTNPMFNDQKMKLGLFGTNCSYGLIMSHAPTTYEATWAHTKEIAQRADALGFEALVPIARWRGFGGTTNFNGNCFETYTWAAGLAEATENIVFAATSHVPTVHPIVAAKQAATIDHISNGRFALNLVMGWFTPEMEMFQGTQRAHDDRYRYGAEWLSVVKRLWTEEAPFDFETADFHIKQAQAHPKPVQKPYPVLINAGHSPAARDFSAREVDFSFVGFDSVEAVRSVATRVRELARTDYRRDIGICTRLDQQQLVEPDAAMPVADPAHGGLVQGDGRTPAVQHDEVVAAAMHLHERDRSHAPGG